MDDAIRESKEEIQRTSKEHNEQKPDGERGDVGQESVESVLARMGELLRNR